MNFRPRYSHLAPSFGLVIVLPALFVFAAVVGGPFFRAMFMSLHEYTISTPAPIFVGLQNFVDLFQIVEFWNTWLRTIVYVVLNSSLTIALGTTLGILLNEPLPLQRLFRSLALLPWVMPSVVTAMLWAWLLHGQYGLLNAALLSAGLMAKPVFWLSSETGAFVSVVVAKSWLSTPVVMIFVLASMQSLPEEQVEAARLDGARNRDILRFVILPHLRPVLVIVTVLQAMGNLQQFDVIYAMTAGGPVHATTTFSINVYRLAFQDWNLGMASSVGVIWFVTIAIPALFYLRTIMRDPT